MNLVWVFLYDVIAINKPAAGTYRVDSATSTAGAYEKPSTGLKTRAISINN
jgi:hypothetical protein